MLRNNIKNFPLNLILVETDSPFLSPVPMRGKQNEPSFIKFTFEFLSNNIRIMENTFTLVKKFKKPFLFASSQMSNMTYSNYGILKNLGEKYSEILDGLVVKFWNVFGIHVGSILEVKELPKP